MTDPGNHHRDTHESERGRAVSLELATLIASITLACLTAAYVYATFRLVGEARKSRKEAESTRLDIQAGRALALQPDLVLDLKMITKRTVGARVINVGQGPALDVRLTLTFEPRPGTGTVVDARPWQTNVILPGEGHTFGPPMTDPNVAPSFATLATRYERITLRGSVRDLLDRTHTVEAAVDDVPARQREGAAALHVYEEAPIRKVGRELNRTLKTVARALRRRDATPSASDSQDDASDFEQEKWW